MVLCEWVSSAAAAYILCCLSLHLCKAGLRTLQDLGPEIRLAMNADLEEEDEESLEEEQEEYEEQPEVHSTWTLNVSKYTDCIFVYTSFIHCYTGLCLLEMFLEFTYCFVLCGVSIILATHSSQCFHALLE